MVVDDTPELREALARAVLDDLDDRRGLKAPLLRIQVDDPDIYTEIQIAIGAAVFRVLQGAAEKV